MADYIRSAKLQSAHQHTLDPSNPAVTQPDRVVGVDDPHTKYLCRKLLTLPADDSAPPASTANE